MRGKRDFYFYVIIQFVKVNMVTTASTSRRGSGPDMGSKNTAKENTKFISNPFWVPRIVADWTAEFNLGYA